MKGSHPVVAELQGLYGPFAFPELLLQKLWWRKEYASVGMRTLDGRELVVHASGRWNRLGGPDFRDAVLDLGGQRVRGDVEVHLRAEDWVAHRHADDPAYADVVLHVVLFPPKTPSTCGSGGREIPIVVLLPLLWHDLEEYATDEAVARSLNRAEHRIAAELTLLAPEALLELLERHARERWREKVRFAKRRIERLGWHEACHQTALEVLGYRSNRAGMLRVAARWPLSTWVSGQLNLEIVFAEFADVWVRQGVRPANHPRHRLRQYQTWTQLRPQWPDLLAEWGRARQSSVAVTPARGFRGTRRNLGFPAAWRELQQRLGGGAVMAPRADNVLADGLLPLLAARGEWDDASAFGWWWHGYPGDLPDALHRALRELGLGGTAEAPFAVGSAQGLLGWLIAQDLTGKSTAAGSDGAGA